MRCRPCWGGGHKSFPVFDVFIEFGPGAGCCKLCTVVFRPPFENCGVNGLNVICFLTHGISGVSLAESSVEWQGSFRKK